jgi:hypothetical protein
MLAMTELITYKQPDSGFFYAHTFTDTLKQPITTMLRSPYHALLIKDSCAIKHQPCQYISGDKPASSKALNGKYSE